ncbi:hypothetical protein SAMN05444008_112153 [Cnuella takakiae]|uniref:Uncharacterized protein n=1 Tax=Cnuella takakiae TaxID=1302690 RepID=A0A1M5ERT3_9BACT|nr:hypothetical protein [Cnuella takakiae]OLY91272.1 hypothetical protein BUE76_04665 [Cnuella takakiae]SHF81722.1 hypothetical protein SAMN05444008_112153 [Cnuella takakiae]
MSENRNSDMNQDRSGMDNTRGSEGLGGQSQSSDSLQDGQRQDMGNQQQDMGGGTQGHESMRQGGAESDRQDTGGQPMNIERSSVADYGSSGVPLDSGDSGRGGSTGSGRTDTGGLDDMDENNSMGHNRSGAGGM